MPPILLQARSKVTTAKAKPAKTVAAKTKPKAKEAKVKTAKKATTKTTAKPKTPSMLAAHSDVAQKLDNTGVWKRTGGRKKADAIRAIEPRRVNIVSDSLCGKRYGALGFEIL